MEPRRMLVYSRVTSIPRRKLIELLERHHIGDALSDVQTAECCGLPTAPGQAGYGHLNAAMHHVAKNFGMVWKRQRREGCIKCLSPSEVLAYTDSSTKHIRRESVKAVTRLRTIALDDVAEADRPAVLSRIAQMGTLAEFARGKVQKKLEDAKVGEFSSKKLLDFLK